MNKVKFNQVTEDEDIKKLAAMADEIWHEYFPCILSLQQIDYMVKMFLAFDSIKKEIEEGYQFYFENDGEKNVGFVVLKPEEERLFISKLYIHKDYRGQGYGTPMFEFAKKIAVQYDLDKMYLTVNKYNTSSIDIYKKKNFYIIDSVVTDIGNGYIMDDYIFEYKIHKGEMAKQYFLQGYNCSQAVAASFSKELNLSKNEAVRYAAAFGGGMSRLREVCGAVSGMFLVLGYIYGNTDPKNITQKNELYKKVQELAGMFKEEHGSIVCRELLGLDHKSDGPQSENRDEKYYKKRPCAEIVSSAADILEKYLEVAK